jgi:hypothetical protein
MSVVGGNFGSRTSGFGIAIRMRVCAFVPA